MKLLGEEDMQLLKYKLDEVKDVDLIKVCNLIYSKGYNVAKACKAGGRTVRAYQIKLKNRTKGLLKLSDLRLLYKMNHPKFVFQKLSNSSKKRHFNRYIPPKIRYKILLTHGFACDSCGRKPPEVKLHIDHKVPVVKGGSNKAENLTCLCSLCNMGKSDVLIDKMWGEE